ncbi:hypothetical protein N7445_002215 [Penicillium cf. griseofulvum]|nr:hypothetical protein N7445_002215 [Penicillium cf. griseofulvum]
MFLCTVGLLTLSLFQLVHGISFLSPTPTPTLTLPDTPHPDAPQPTSGTNLRRWGIMRRDDDLVTSSYDWDDNVCGWENASFGDYSTMTCQSDLTCVHHASNSNWPGMIGCCKTSNCAFRKTCYGDDEASKLAKTSDQFTLLCTVLSSAACVTYDYPDLNARNYACGPTSSIQNMFTFALNNPSTGALTVRYDHSLRTIGDDIVSSYVSRFSLSPTRGDDTSTSSSATISSSESSKATPTPTSEPSSPPLETEKSNSTTSVGAIAGGVVGGVAGGAAIALAGVFLCRRRKKRRSQPKAGGGSDYGSGGPQSMSESQPSYLTVGTQPPSEMESRPSSYQFPQAQDTASANRPHEMQGDTHHVVEADSNHVSHSKDNAAELPTESTSIARP